MTNQVGCEELAIKIVKHKRKIKLNLYPALLSVHKPKPVPPTFPNIQAVRFLILGLHAFGKCWLNKITLLRISLRQCKQFNTQLDLFRMKPFFVELSVSPNIVQGRKWGKGHSWSWDMSQWWSTSSEHMSPGLYPGHSNMEATSIEWVGKFFPCLYRQRCPRMHQKGSEKDSCLLKRWDM